MYDSVARAGPIEANGVRARHGRRYGDSAGFATGRGQAGALEFRSWSASKDLARRWRPSFCAYTTKPPNLLFTNLSWTLKTSQSRAWQPRSRTTSGLFSMARDLRST